MRVRKRDVKQGLVFYQCKDSDMQMLKPVSCVGSEVEEFVLVRPMRVSEDGVIETLTVLEEVPFNSTYCTDDDDIYMEVEDAESFPAADLKDKEDDNNRNKRKPPYNEEQDDTSKYTYLGTQKWLVYNTSYPTHTYGKTIRFLLGRSFEADCEKKNKSDKIKEDRGLPIAKSIAYEDYLRKDKRINKNFRNDDFNSIF